MIEIFMSIYCIFVGFCGIRAWLSWDEEQNTFLSAIGLVICGPIGLIGLLALAIIIFGGEN